jgi:hypothetical protein
MAPEDPNCLRNQLLELFLQQAPVIQWYGELYHGSPVDGIDSLVENPSPQTHHLGFLLSASSNDNVIDSYAEGEKSGVVWNIPPDDPIRVLDDRAGRIQQLILAPYFIRQEAASDHHLPGYQEDIRLLQEKGFLDQDLEWSRELWDPECEDSPDIGRYLDLAGLDAIALPGFEDWEITQHTSNEIAFGTQGCEKLFRHLQWVCLEDQWLPTQIQQKSA